MVWVEPMDEEIIAKAVEHIESLSDKERISTSEVLKIVGIETIDLAVGFKYHRVICEEIEKRGIVELDMSEYKDKDVGLPYNIPYIIRRV